MIQTSFAFAGAWQPGTVIIPMPEEPSLGGLRNFYYLRDVPAPKVTCAAYLQSAFLLSAIPAPTFLYTNIDDSECWVFDTVNNFGCYLTGFSINPDGDIQATTAYFSHPDLKNPDRTQLSSIEAIDLIRILCSITKCTN